MITARKQASFRIVPNGANAGTGTYLVVKADGAVVADGTWTAGNGAS